VEKEAKKRVLTLGVDVNKERMDVYKKIKDILDYLHEAAMNEDLTHTQRIRAARAISTSLVDSLRKFILDKENLKIVEKKVEQLERAVFRGKDRED